MGAARSVERLFCRPIWYFLPCARHDKKNAAPKPHSTKPRPIRIDWDPAMLLLDCPVVTSGDRAREIGDLSSASADSGSREESDSSLKPVEGAAVPLETAVASLSFDTGAE